MFDRGYLDYDRFCALEEREEDFVCLLQSDSRVDVLERIQDIDITDEVGTRHVRDDLIELAETGETFRRIVFEDVDGEEIAYLTTLSPERYDPVALIGYVLVEWFRHSHPLRGGVPEAIRLVRTRWNQLLPVYG